MTESVQSPNSLELKGKPPLGPRFGMKAGFAVFSVLALAVGLVMYGIITRDPNDAALNAATAPNLTPATTAGQRLYEGVGDGVLGRHEPSPAPVPALDMPGQTITAESLPSLEQAQTPAAVAAAPAQPTPEELAAARLRELREQERMKAINAGSEVPFGGLGGNVVAEAAPMSDEALREAALRRITAQSEAAQGQGLPTAALNAMRSGGGMFGASLQDDPNLQARKEGFIAAAAEQQASETLRGTRRAATTAFELKAGTIIPTVLLTGLNSDLPGEIIGQVSENVFDSATGRHLLIPQGARVFGHYDSRVAYGQDRALVVWDRLIYPDGSSLTLQGMGGADKSGYAGFHDKVNNHIWRLLGYGAISSAFASVFHITQRHQQNRTDGQQSASQVAAAEVARQYSQLGQQMAQRNLNIQPTIEIRPGYQFVVMVNRDMVFPNAYKEKVIR